MVHKAGKSTKSWIGHNFVGFGHYFVVFGPSSWEVDLSGPFCKMCKPINRDRIVMLRYLLSIFGSLYVSLDMILCL